MTMPETKPIKKLASLFLISQTEASRLNDELRSAIAILSSESQPNWDINWALCQKNCIDLLKNIQIEAITHLIKTNNPDHELDKIKAIFLNGKIYIKDYTHEDSKNEKHKPTGKYSRADVIAKNYFTIDNHGNLKKQVFQTRTINLTSTYQKIQNSKRNDEEKQKLINKIKKRSKKENQILERYLQELRNQIP